MSDPFGDYTSGVSFTATATTPTRSTAPQSARARPPPPPPKPDVPDGRERSRSSPVAAVTEKPRKPQPVVQPPAPIIHSGLLAKKSGLVIPSYHPHFFILTPRELWYYETAEDFEHQAPPKRKLPIEKSTYVMDDGSSGTRLSIVSHGKTVVVRAESREEMAEWKARLLECLQGAHSNTAFTASPLRQ